MKLAVSSPNELKTLAEKEKLPSHKQYLLFPQCFQKICTADTLKKKKKKTGLVSERVKVFFLNTAGNLLKTLWERVFLNIV